MVLRPLGYLAFVVALAALSASSRLLGDKHELGFFAGRLSQTLWRYPEVTRRGIAVAWVIWGVLLIVSVSPADPLASDLDELAIGALGALLVLRGLYASRRGAR